jgi:hypothetical protein
LRPVAFFLGFLLTSVEALSLPAGVPVGFFVNTFLLHDLFFGRVAEVGATAVPGVLFDFMAPHTSFFAFFRWGK